MIGSGSPLAHLAQGPIFIVGATRSGTTWVYDILTTHPQVAGVSESFMFSPVGLSGLFRPIHHGDAGLGRLLSREELILEVRELASRLLARALGPEHRYLVEKSGSHAQVMSLIGEVFPTARFVHVLRDGRDVCVSVRASALTWAPGWGRTWARNMYSAAREWATIVSSARDHAADLGERFLEIRYEDIKRNPFEAYRRLFDFCGIPHDEVLLRHVFERTDFESNYRPREDAFHRRGQVGDWKTHFNLLDAWAFKRAAGRELIEHGYETTSRWRSPLFRKVRLPRKKG